MGGGARAGPGVSADQLNELLVASPLMSKLTEKIGPSMDRETVANVRKAGFDITEVDHVFLDVVKIIKAVKPAT